MLIGDRGGTSEVNYGRAGGLSLHVDAELGLSAVYEMSTGEASNHEA